MLLGAHASLAAQERSSHYLHLGHWAYRYVDLLVARGRLPDLQPMVRPYRRLDIARAIARAEDRGSLSAPEGEWLALLRAEFAAELGIDRVEPDAEGMVARGGIEAGAWGLTQRHRDPLRPEGDNAGFGFVQLSGALDFPGVTAALRFRYDGWLNNDPQFPDGVVEQHPGFLGFLDFAGRPEDGYAELQLPYLRVMAGRLSRNWGAPGSHGFLVSDYTYSYDQIAYRLGSDRLSVVGFVAQLEEFPNDVKRWFSAHRLDWRVSDRLWLGFGESVVWGGENRSFDFRMVMPIGLWFVGGFGEDWVEGPNRNNSFIELSAWWTPSPGVVVNATAMLDDFPGGGSPLAHGVQLGVGLPNVSSRLGLRLDYSQVGALTYRPPWEEERYTLRGIGLGRDMADHDRLSFELDWVPHPSVFLIPSVQLLRRGEGDFADPWPDMFSDWDPVLFIGEVEKTLRLAVKGQWIQGSRLWVDWDVGQNVVWSADHVPGADRSEFVGRVRVSMRVNGWTRFR